MVFFNYATMQMAAKIVYYGPGLCGKTTNLHHIYGKTSPQSRGEMVSLETETDRTLFFDLLPIDVGVIGGFKTRLQLYTVPGQVFYNTTRKLVLKGADGIVFVADSQRAMLDANADSFKNLRENLTEIGLQLDEIPLVIQMNKRDLPNVASRDEMLQKLDPERRFEHVEAAAVKGDGVFETLKLISKLTLRTLRRRMMGEEPKKVAATPRTGPTFIVHETPRSESTQPASAHPAIAAAAPVMPDEPLQVPESPRPPTPATHHTSAGFENMDISYADAPIPPVPQPQPPPPPAAPAEPPHEQEIEFSQTEKPADVKPAEVKHVKVRSSIDIMAELEQLRKKATQTPSRAKMDVLSALDALTTTSRPKKETMKHVSIHASPDAFAKSRKLKVIVQFQDGNQEVVQTEEQVLDLEKSATNQTLQVNLKIDFGSNSGQSN